jgi:hypothetical protein
MANEERLIYANALKAKVEKSTASKAVKAVTCVFIEDAPTVDAVPVDEIILHHILIDENGIPEVKLQFGDRTLVLRREDDPLYVREVVHGRWVHDGRKFPGGVDWWRCSECGKLTTGVGAKDTYCPNCGADMRGSEDA